MKPRRSRIARKLTLCMVCLLLPIILINVALNVYNVVNLKRELEHSSEALFSTLSEEVEGTLTNIQINAYTLGSEIELKALNFAEESVTGKILDYWDQTKKLSYGNTAQKKVPNTAECDIIKSWINR